MRGDPHSTTSTRLSLASPLKPPNCQFSRAWQRNKGKATSPISALHYPTSPSPRHRAPTNLPIITCQGKRRAILRRRAPLEDVPIDLLSIDLVSIVVIFFVPLATPLSLLGVLSETIHSPPPHNHSVAIAPASFASSLVASAESRGAPESNTTSVCNVIGSRRMWTWRRRRGLTGASAASSTDSDVVAAYYYPMGCWSRSRRRRSKRSRNMKNEFCSGLSSGGFWVFFPSDDRPVGLDI